MAPYAENPTQTKQGFPGCREPIGEKVPLLSPLWAAPHPGFRSTAVRAIVLADSASSFLLQSIKQ